MKPMLSLLLYTLFLQVHAQDSLPKRLYKYKVVVRETTGLKRTGYLALINDSALYISTAQVAINTPKPALPASMAIDYSQVNAVYVKRKGSVGRGILIGALSGLAAGAITGLVSGGDPSCQGNYATNNSMYGISYSLCNTFRISAGEMAAIGGAFGLVTGSLIGGIVGAVARKKFIILGSREKFNAMQLTVLERVYGK